MKRTPIYECRLTNSTLRTSREATSPLSPMTGSFSKFEIRNSKLGFTLIELLVVISIIVVLIGIGYGVYSKFFTSVNESTTKMILQAGANAEVEYRATIQSTIDHENNWSGAYAENAPGFTGSASINGGLSPRLQGLLSGDTTEQNRFRVANLLSERFVWAIMQVPDAEKILRNQDAHLYDSDGDHFMELLDAWDQPIIYQRAEPDDGTIANKPRLRPNHRPFLVSAGPDGKWGDYNPVSGPDADATDNIYSYDVE